APGRLGGRGAEPARMHALFLGHRGAMCLRVPEIVVALRVLGGRDRRKDHPRSDAPREPSEQPCPRRRSPGPDRVTGAEKAALPERRMLLLDRRKTTVDAPDVRASLAVGHRQVLERAVHLLLSILEPTRDAGLLLAAVPRVHVRSATTVPDP